MSAEVQRAIMSKGKQHMKSQAQGRQNEDLSTKQRLLHSNTEAGIKYRGLVNMGSTCYLNSVLQVLFMTPEFRDAVERCDDTSHSTFIDAELKDLFRTLREQSCSPKPPPSLIRKLDIDNVHEQQDAAEYLERILRLTRLEASQVFHGELTHHTECCRCKKGSDEHGLFWTLNLGINSVPTKVYDVQDGLEAFFRQSQLTGDNQLYCDTCQAKEDSIIECIFKKPPEVLVVLLKRFEFSYDIMGYVKNDSPVNVLLNIEIPKGRSYELYATVDHYGDLSGGHYSATIKSPDDADSWYNFNDSHVTRKDRFNPDGSSSAYLLFYRHRVCDMSQTSNQMNDSLQGVHVGSSMELQSGSSVDPERIGSIQNLDIYIEEEEVRMEKGKVVTERIRTKVGEINPEQLKVLKLKRKQEIIPHHLNPKQSKPTQASE